MSFYFVTIWRMFEEVVLWSSFLSEDDPPCAWRWSMLLLRALLSLSLSLFSTFWREKTDNRTLSEAISSLTTLTTELAWEQYYHLLMCHLEVLGNRTASDSSVETFPVIIIVNLSPSLYIYKHRSKKGSQLFVSALLLFVVWLSSSML